MQIYKIFQAKASVLPSFCPKNSSFRCHRHRTYSLRLINGWDNEHLSNHFGGVFLYRVLLCQRIGRGEAWVGHALEAGEGVVNVPGVLRQSFFAAELIGLKGGMSAAPYLTRGKVFKALNGIATRNINHQSHTAKLVLNVGVGTNPS